ncbi:MAG: coenzyme F420-0:L-glutamate ligase [Methanosarcinales archaeon]|nr:coenzyme F420-0:L-glutamate ligase [Methanosarcinales archaeon]
MNGQESVGIYLVRGLPRIREGDDLASMIESRVDLMDGDVVCLASTIVAKAEGRAFFLDDFAPSSRAMEIAEPLGKDPRFVQAVMDESREILLDSPFLLVVTSFGHICVNAGIDQSNVDQGRILLLPRDPSASAERIRRGLSRDCAVIITDTCGRPFRRGVGGVAIGWSGIAPLKDWRGQQDLSGRPLEITLEAIVDEIAGMANLMMGEAGGGTPAVVIRGLDYPRSGDTLFRPVDEDVIRRRLRS